MIEDKAGPELVYFWFRERKNIFKEDISIQLNKNFDIQFDGKANLKAFHNEN